MFVPPRNLPPATEFERCLIRSSGDRAGALHFPKVKTLDEFNFQEAQHLPVTLIRHLAEGGYIGKTEPVLFLGDTGTGKTHLATALGVAACRQRKRVRFTTAAEMVNELVEARPPSAGYRLSKFLKRHKGPVVAASLVLVALLTGILGTTWGLFEAKQQEQGE